VVAVDTSVVVPALALWHEHHAKAYALLDEEPEVQLLGHVAIETYSVLTRMRPPKRARPAHVARALRETFTGSARTLAADEYLRLLERAADWTVEGGAIYDALVAATAKQAGLELVSLDRRAAAVYATVGVSYRLL
jgi:predicted nucleic acid-binding protein